MLGCSLLPVQVGSCHCSWWTSLALRPRGIHGPLRPHCAAGPVLLVRDHPQMTFYDRTHEAVVDAYPKMLRCWSITTV